MYVYWWVGILSKHNDEASFSNTTIIRSQLSSSVYSFNIARNMNFGYKFLITWSHLFLFRGPLLWIFISCMNFSSCRSVGPGLKKNRQIIFFSDRKIQICSLDFPDGWQFVTVNFHDINLMCHQFLIDFFNHWWLKYITDGQDSDNTRVDRKLFRQH